jgi:hypothetical protein
MALELPGALTELSVWPAERVLRLSSRGPTVTNGLHRRKFSPGFPCRGD